MAANTLTLGQWLEAPRRSPAPRPPRDGITPDLVHTPWAQNIKKGLPSDPVEIYKNPEWHGVCRRKCARRFECDMLLSEVLGLTHILHIVCHCLDPDQVLLSCK